jgi:hypothetical protein
MSSSDTGARAAARPYPRYLRYLPYLLIGVATLLLFLWLDQRPAARVGDGSEYYAMFVSWSESLRPWTTAASNAAYDAMMKTNEVSGLVERKWFDISFPALRVGDTTDFNHFWFYSLLAVICQKAALLVGIHLSVDASFLALHGLLLGGATALAYRHYGWRGAGIIVLMVVGSPVLWFLDKVHTEAYTVCVLLIGMMQMHRARYASASLMFAMAATQNPSFALIAGVPWAYRVVLQWGQRYSVAEALLMLASAALVLLHPAYYEMRYGVITPQLLAGGAALGLNLSSFYIWVFDPDLGLLPNWPLGIAAVLLGLVMWYRRRRQPGRDGSKWHEVLFYVVFLLVNFYAHGSTGNINSGATPGLARYALWYLPLLFPLLLWISAQWHWKSASGYALALAVLALTVLTVERYQPRGPELYDQPSTLSYLVQEKLPGLYNPPPELFMERFSGGGERRSFDVIVGPDCSKMLMMSFVQTPGVSSPDYCLFDKPKLAAFRAAIVARNELGAYRYVRLTPEQQRGMLMTVNAEPYRVGKDDTGRFILDAGWDSPEPWGVWSVAPVATLNIPCNDVQFFKAAEPFMLSLVLQPFGDPHVVISDDSGVLYKGPLPQGGPPLKVKVPGSNCHEGKSRVHVQVPKLVSPAELGMSTDARKLGVALHGFQVSKAQ